MERIVAESQTKRIAFLQLLRVQRERDRIGNTITMNLLNEMSFSVITVTTSSRWNKHVAVISQICNHHHSNWKRKSFHVRMHTDGWMEVCSRLNGPWNLGGTYLSKLTAHKFSTDADAESRRTYFVVLQMNPFPSNWRKYCSISNGTQSKRRSKSATAKLWITITYVHFIKWEMGNISLM